MIILGISVGLIFSSIIVTLLRIRHRRQRTGDMYKGDYEDDMAGMITLILAFMLLYGLISSLIFYKQLKLNCSQIVKVESISGVQILGEDNVIYLDEYNQPTKFDETGNKKSLNEKDTEEIVTYRCDWNDNKFIIVPVTRKHLYINTK